MDFNSKFDKSLSSAKPVKKTLIFISMCFFGGLALLVDYYFPSYHKVVLLTQETKEISINEKQTKTVHLLTARIIEQKGIRNNKLLTLRNENTSFGFPFYFKFNADKIEKQSEKLIKDKSVLEIKTYGFYLPFLDEYPNLISMRKLKKSDVITEPGAKYAWFSMIAIFFALSLIFIKNTFRYD